MISEKIFFIVGNSRSGTTMLGRILGNSPQIHTFGELHFFEHQVCAEDIHERRTWPSERRIALVERLLTSSRKGFFAPVHSGEYREDAVQIVERASDESALSSYAEFLGFETSRAGKLIPCEQTPRYLFFVEEILGAFPDCRVVNMIRDPRDVLLSQKNKWRRRGLGAKNIPVKEVVRAWANYHPYTISRLWVSAVRKADKYEKHPRFKSIRFEDLVEAPDQVVRELCEFLNVPFEESMLAVPQVGSSTGVDRPDRLGVAGGRAGAWRKGGLTSTEIEICQRVAGPAMREHGYSCEPVSPSSVRRYISMLQFGLKGAAALLLNLGRTRNLRETLKRRLAS